MNAANFYQQNQQYVDQWNTPIFVTASATAAVARASTMPPSMSSSSSAVEAAAIAAPKVKKRSGSIKVGRDAVEKKSGDDKQPEAEVASSSIFKPSAALLIGRIKQNLFEHGSTSAAQVNRQRPPVDPVLTKYSKSSTGAKVVQSESKDARAPNSGRDESSVPYQPQTQLQQQLELRLQGSRDDSMINAETSAKRQAQPKKRVASFQVRGNDNRNQVVEIDVSNQRRQFLGISDASLTAPAAGRMSTGRFFSASSSLDNTSRTSNAPIGDYCDVTTSVTADQQRNNFTDNRNMPQRCYSGGDGYNRNAARVIARTSSQPVMNDVIDGSGRCVTGATYNGAADPNYRLRGSASYRGSSAVDAVPANVGSGAYQAPSGMHVVSSSSRLGYDSTRGAGDYTLQPRLHVNGDQTVFNSGDQLPPSSSLAAAGARRQRSVRHSEVRGPEATATTRLDAVNANDAAAADVEMNYLMQTTTAATTTTTPAHSSKIRQSSYSQAMACQDSFGLESSPLTPPSLPDTSPPARGQVSASSDWSDGNRYVSRTQPFYITSQTDVAGHEFDDLHSTTTRAVRIHRSLSSMEPSQQPSTTSPLNRVDVSFSSAKVQDSQASGEMYCLSEQQMAPRSSAPDGKTVGHSVGSVPPLVVTFDSQADFADDLSAGNDTDVLRRVSQEICRPVNYSGTAAAPQSKYNNGYAKLSSSASAPRMSAAAAAALSNDNNNGSHYHSQKLESSPTAVSQRPHSTKSPSGSVELCPQNSSSGSTDNGDADPNFVRNHRVQMSMRKAYGIFDEADVEQRGADGFQRTRSSCMPSLVECNSSHPFESNNEHHQMPPKHSLTVEQPLQQQRRLKERRTSDSLGAHRKQQFTHDLGVGGGQKHRACSVTDNSHFMLSRSGGHGHLSASSCDDPAEFPDTFGSVTTTTTTGNLNSDMHARLSSSDGMSSSSLYNSAVQRAAGGRSVVDPDVQLRNKQKSVSLPRGMTSLDSGVSSSSFSSHRSPNSSVELDRSFSVGRVNRWSMLDYSSGGVPAAHVGATPSDYGSSSGISFESNYWSSNAPTDDVSNGTSSSSPPPPALPPRRYRYSVDNLQSVGNAPQVFVDAGEGTLREDSYAHQIRRQARRLSQSSRGSFSNQTRPTAPPSWRPPPMPFQSKIDADEPVVVQRRVSPAYYGSSAENSATPQDNSRKHSAVVGGAVEPRGSVGSSSYGTAAADSMYADVTCSSQLSPDSNQTVRAMTSSSRFVDDGRGQTNASSARPDDSNAGNSDENDSSRVASNTRSSPGSASDQRGVKPAEPVVVYEQRHSEFVSSASQHQTDVKRFDSVDEATTTLKADLGDSGRYINVSKVAMATDCQTTNTAHKADDSPLVRASSVGGDVVSVSPRSQSKQVEPLDVTDDKSSVANDKSAVDDNEGKSSGDVQRKDSLSGAALSECKVVIPKNFWRRRLSEEAEYDKQALNFVKHLKSIDREHQIIDILAPNSKCCIPMDYMIGPTDDNKDQLQPDLSESLRLRLTARQARHSASLHNGENVVNICSTGPAPVTSSGIVHTHKSVHDWMTSGGFEHDKSVLIGLVERKLSVLRHQKQLLEEEVSENNSLGSQIKAVAEGKLQPRECDKYQQFIRDVDKVTGLRLKLSDMLARAENVVRCLSTNVGEKEKSRAVSKRDELVEKYDDASSLKADIEQQNRPIVAALYRSLSLEEFSDYEYFALMKTQLAIELQDVEYSIQLADRQLQLLHSSAIHISEC